jgi:DNA-binding protein YbaB
MRALSAASSDMTPVTVEDEKKAVKITLATNGGVESLALDEDWRDKIDEEALGLTVTTCYRTALETRVAQWMQSYTDNAEQVAADADVSVPTPAPVELGDPSAAWAVEGREQLRAMYDAADAEQEAFLTHRAQRARQARDGVNSAKTVTVTREGDTITNVALDPRWVKNTNDGVIEGEIVKAMNGVMAMAARERENKYEGFPAIEQLAQMAHNPSDLMRRMGVIR